MKYQIKPTTKFTKDLKRIKKRECHIRPDWLLIYETNKNSLILYLTRTGSHSDLF
ncbi:MAG: type II toxin-antitoxin system mRNA interferase toxin, RelE/StbE family [Erysipelotrichaceae bacterium]